MTELREFENELRAMLADVEASARPSTDLVGRLVHEATRRNELVQPSARSLTRRILPPLLAAAAVVIAVVVTLGVVSGSRADKKNSPATNVPSPTVTPTSPPLTASPSPTPRPSNSAVKEPPGVPIPAGFEAPGTYGTYGTYFRDSLHGYTLGNVPCPASPGYCATLIRTNDGGAHWVKIPLPAGLTPVDDKGNASGGSCGTNGEVYGPCVDKVAFADALHGYVWSLHSFYRTVDGGTTWKHDNENRAVWKLVIVGNRVIRIGGLSVCSSGCKQFVQVSTVGSSQWTDSQPPAVLAFASDLFLAGRDVYVAGSTIDESGNRANRASLFRSSDAGRTWHPANVGDCVWGSAAAPDGALATTSVCKFGDVPMLQIFTGSSSEAGPTHALRGLPDFYEGKLVAFSASRLMWFVDTSTTRYSGKWQVFLSTDGGATWSAQPQDGHQSWVPLTASFAYRGSSDGKSVEVTSDAGKTFVSRPFR